MFKETIISRKESIFSRIIIPITLLLVGIYLVPLKICGWDLSKIPGDLIDARFNNYILEHGYLFLTGKIHNFWDASFMYPFKNVIAFSDNFLGVAPLYSFFRIIGKDRETAYQLIYFSLFILNYCCCYWALKKWSGHSILSATGAYIFTFSIFIYTHIYHIQNFPRFIVPLAFYWLWKYLSEKQIRYLLYTMLALVFQFYCAVYLGFFLAYGLIFLFIAYIIVYRDKTLITQFRDLKRAALSILIIVGSILLLAPLMIPYYKMSQLFGMRKFEDVVNTIPFIRSYFFSTSISSTWQILAFHGVNTLPESWCHTLFFGALPWIGVLMILIVLLFRLHKDPSKKFLLFLIIALFFSFIFCLNLNGFTLYHLIFELPGFSSMRAIHRVSNIEVVFFVLVFVFVLKHLADKNRIAYLSVFFLPLLVVADNFPDISKVTTFEKAESQRRIELAKKNIADNFDPQAPHAIAYFTKERDYQAVVVNVDVMLAAQDLGIPCVNAYSGACPGEYNAFYNHPGKKELIGWLNYNHFPIEQIQIITPKEENSAVYIKSANQQYLSEDRSQNNFIVASRDNPGEWETFILVKLNDNTYAIQGSDKLYWTIGTDSGRVNSTSHSIGQLEKFEVIRLNKDTVALKAFNGRYVSIDNLSLQLFASSTGLNKNQKFLLQTAVNDSENQYYIQGSNGKYFSIGKDDVVADNTDSTNNSTAFSIIKAENNLIGLSTPDGFFVSADYSKNSLVYANRDQMNSWEKFTEEKLPDGYIAFRSDNGKYLSIDQKTSCIYANSDAIGNEQKFKLIPKDKK